MIDQFQMPSMFLCLVRLGFLKVPFLQNIDGSLPQLEGELGWRRGEYTWSGEGVRNWKRLVLKMAIVL